MSGGPLVIRRMHGSRGFSLVELLVALAICAVVSAGVAVVVPPARTAFETAPAEMELQQRGRIAVRVAGISARADLHGLQAETGYIIEHLIQRFLAEQYGEYAELHGIILLIEVGAAAHLASRKRSAS